GAYIKFIPYPVTVGFTAGIAVIIFASQVKELFGITLAGKEPGEFIPKLVAIWDSFGTISPAATAIAALSILIIVGLKRFRPGWPGMLIAIGVAAVAAYVFALPVETIATRYGGIPRTLPMPALPEISVERMLTMLPSAISFTLLGAIESLLSAVVADGMTGRRHRSNCELVAQGFANIAAALFGGMPVTGTIARTATNVRAGAHGPVAGMLHAVFLLLFMLVAAPLAGYIPLAALAGVLAIVAWNMIEKDAFRALIRSSKGDALVLLVTFGLVIFRDLTEGIVVGFLLGSILFIDRMAKSIAVETDTPFVTEDVADSTNGGRMVYNALDSNDPHIVIYRISGAFFFGAASTVGAVLDRIADRHKAFILDCAAVPFLDSTAANVLEMAVRKAERSGVRVFITGAAPQVRRMLFTHGVRPPHVRYKATIEAAVRQARREVETEAA
ncbi:MAG: SulP family inorganic anion transporter, partial [Mesorhizobium sp.]|nr:SulP family inorganic anion transporter [Mesorhizobium sp.]